MAAAIVPAYTQDNDVVTDYYLEEDPAPVVSIPRERWYSLGEWVRDSIYYRRTTRGRIEVMKKVNSSATINLPEKTMMDRNIEEIARMAPKQDTIIVRDDISGKDMILMHAIMDDDGSMVATEQLQAAVVTARFRNVAERNGKVDLEFDITVPQSLYDSKWQLRFYPTLTVLDNTRDLESVFITGANYRRNQLKGYERYNRFLSTIINDPLKFIDLDKLEIFLKRNIPQLYAYKLDSTIVSEEEFATVYGVTERDAIAHYTNVHAISRNNRRIAAKKKMYEKYVKSPIEEFGIRLDTVMQNLAGDYVYSYTETIQTSRNLKKAEIRLSGEIYEDAKCLYTMPESDPLAFYISSLSSFIDETPRYMLQIVERRAAANSSYNIDFEVGKSNIVSSLRNNASEIERIKGDLASLMKNETFDLDSIIVTAYASPEGSVQANNVLCRRRADAVNSYFNSYVHHFEDSLRAEMGVSIDLSGDREKITDMYEGADIRFISHLGGENWKQLTQEIEMNEYISDEDKEEYYDIINVSNLDAREARLKRLRSYRHIKEDLYPACRTVRFDFMLHRKGMVKDTVHTTILDTTYMRGVELMRDRDFESALVLLRPYQDYNTAVAFVAMDYNVSAMTILQDLPQTAKTEYLKAIIYARQNDDQNAVQCFMNAARADRAYFNRGNLDPEIRAIIRRYNLDALDQDEYDDFSY